MNDDMIFYPMPYKPLTADKVKADIGEDGIHLSKSACPYQIHVAG